MPTVREIRRRMRSITNTRQITRAMEMVAVTRMRRAQLRVQATRPYADKMRQVLADLMARTGGREGAAPHPLLVERTVRRIALVAFTTDRGLCGALNANVVRATVEFVLRTQRAGPAVDLVVVGRKGQQLLRRSPVTIIAAFQDLGDRPLLVDTLGITRLVRDGYIAGTFDQVYLVYSRFVSTLRQEPTLRRLLPVEAAAVAGPAVHHIEYIYEPSLGAVLNALLPRFVEVQVYQTILESIASEYSARMMAMRNATENAGELLNTLRLSYNKARQTGITREILEVAAGASALAGR